MAKAGTPKKKKAKPKLTDKEQSERFKETARELGADQESNTFTRLVTELAKQAPEPRRSKK
jgi:hypothetical protein